jgi:hypothetical protein
VRMTAIKFSWYRAFYFPIPVRLFYAGKFGDVGFLREIAGDLDRLLRLIPRVEAMIRRWYELDPRDWRGPGLVKPPEFAAMREVVSDLLSLHEQGPGATDDAALKQRVSEMINLLEAAAVVTFHEAAKSLPSQKVDPEARINPHAVGLLPHRWEIDGLFDDSGITLAEASEVAAGLQAELEQLGSIGQPVH